MNSGCNLVFLTLISCIFCTSCVLCTSSASASSSYKLLEICPNPYGDDGSEYVKFYCDSTCILSDGEGKLEVGEGYYVATKDAEKYREHFHQDGWKVIEFPPGIALSNKGETVCLNDDCFDYSVYLDDGVIYYRKGDGWDFRYEDWSSFECVNDTVNLTFIITPSNFRLPDGYKVASYTFSADFTPAELYVDANPFSLPCRETEIENVHFLSSNSYRVFHYKFAVKGESVVITTENWIFSKKGFVVAFNSSRISKMLESVLDNDVKYDAGFAGKCEKWKVRNSAVSSKPILIRAKVTAFVLPDCNPVFGFISSAKKRLAVIAPYLNLRWFGDIKPSLRSVIENAVERGVDVKVILDRKYAEKSSVEELRKMGVDVIFTSGLHGKAIVADDRLLVTSANMNRYGLKLNREVGVIIYSEELADYVYERFAGEKTPGFEVVIAVVSMLAAGVEGVRKRRKRKV